MINNCLEDKDYELLKIAGVSKSDDLHSIYGKINKHICSKHKKGAVFMIKDFDDEDKKLFEIRKKIEENIIIKVC